jgi:hypothetical protein
MLSEAKCRRDYSVTTYGTIVQINIIFIVLMNSVVKQELPSLLSIIGVIIILIASIGAFINAYGSPKDTTMPIIKYALIATATLGIALFIDGEIVNHFIFSNKITTGKVSAFFFYEMLTFAIPSILTFFVLIIGKANDHLKDLKAIYKANTKDAWLSAFFSVGQFNFSVLALSFSEYRILAVSILGLAPLFSVLIDTNSRITKSKYQKRLDVLFSIIALIGIILTTIYIK